MSIDEKAMVREGSTGINSMVARIAG